MSIKAYEKSGFCQTKTHLVNNGTNQSIAMVFQYVFLIWLVDKMIKSVVSKYFLSDKT